ncbi:ATP-binding cassette domain-containing protein [bacterium]|nr:ATP-binding cassette domain-containing protein [bacterium]
MRLPDAIRLQNVSCRLGGSVVLGNVSFSVSRGEFTYMIGPNGGGKTTLLRLLLGLEKPDSGRISVLGLTPPAANKRIGYLPQHQFFDPQFPITALEAVLTGLSFSPFATGRLREKAISALEEMGLGDEAARSYAVLSGGQRQRVLIARALVGDPELLLLDEPTANVDPAVEEALFDRLARLRRRLTILMVTHDTGVVPAGVERVICVNRTVAVHPTRRLTGRVLQDLYRRSLKRVSHDRIIGERAGGGHG